MNELLALVVIMLSPPVPERPELSPETLPIKESASKDAIEKAFKQLANPCPDRAHINELGGTGDDGSRLSYRPSDLYEDCADELDLLAKTKEAIDERLLERAKKAKDLPERYRTAWVLIQRRNQSVVPVIEKMAESAWLEERYLSWSLYEGAIREKQLTAPQPLAGPLARCKKEENRYVKAEIMQFLGACKSKESVPLLMEALRDELRCDAVWALGAIGDPKSVPAIIAVAKKEKENRGSYFDALGKIGSPEAVDFLIEHLGEGCSVVQGLFESGSPKALPALEEYLDKLKKQAADKADLDLDLAVTQVSVLRLQHKDPREQLLALAEDRKQSQWMRTESLEALGQYDAKPLTGRILKLYRAETDDLTRMFYIRLLFDLPGKEITEAMIDQALADGAESYRFSHYDLLEALNHRLNTSYRTMEKLVEHLRRERAVKEK